MRIESAGPLRTLIFHALVIILAGTGNANEDPGIATDSIKGEQDSLPRVAIEHPEQQIMPVNKFAVMTGIGVTTLSVGGLLIGNLAVDCGSFENSECDEGDETGGVVGYACIIVGLVFTLVGGIGWATSK